MMTQRTFFSSFMLIIVSMIFSLSIVTVVLYVIIQYPSENTIIESVRQRVFPFGHYEYWWRSRFVRMYKDRLAFLNGFQETHPILGWVPKKNVHMTIKDHIVYSSNNIGARSKSDFSRDDRKYVVLAVGDSFTFGNEADDADVWTTILEEKNPRLQVVNMGVGGYGTDQICLRLEQTIGQIKPDLVIAAYISDDLYRSFLSFRDYKKPKFVLEDNVLRLTNTPIGGFDEVYREAMNEIRIQGLGLADILHNLAVNNWERRTALPPNVNPLNNAIFDRMSNIAKTQHTDFLVLFIPSGSELTDEKTTGIGETFFEAYTKSRDVIGLNPRPKFLAAERKDFVKGHYSRTEATILADAVNEKILALTSYAKKIMSISLAIPTFTTWSETPTPLDTTVCSLSIRTVAGCPRSLSDLSSVIR